MREPLGIHAFGVNAFTPDEEGTLINEHDESGSGQEELYIVLEGNATLKSTARRSTPRRDARVGPAGSRRKATGEGVVLALGATPGEAYQALDWGEAWPFQSESMAAYGEQRYGDALEAVRRGLEQVPDHPGLHYNYACFAIARGRHRRRDVRPPASGPSSCSRRSASRRARTRTSPPCATTRGSRRLFAERNGLGLGKRSWR